MAELRRRIGEVYTSHPDIPDHRERHPWVDAFLGHPFAGVWFVAENPSIGMVRRSHPPRGVAPTPEDQWAVSNGDRLLRKMLIKYGWKDGTPESPSGWRCYLTDVIKSALPAEEWKRSGRDWGIVRAFAPVLAWEIKTAHPRLMRF